METMIALLTALAAIGTITAPVAFKRRACLACDYRRAAVNDPCMKVRPARVFVERSSMNWARCSSPLTCPVAGFESCTLDRVYRSKIWNSR